MYEIVFIFAVWSSWVTTAGVFGVGSLFFGVCTHLSGTFNMLRMQIQTLVEREINGVNLIL